MIDRTQKELTKEDIATIANTYHTWRNVTPSIPLKGEDGTVIASLPTEKVGDGGAKQSHQYEDVAGYCKSATLSDIAANDYVLTPGRYVGVAEEEDDGIHFEDKMTELTATLKSQLEQAKALDQAILENLKVLGYE